MINEDFRELKGLVDIYCPAKISTSRDTVNDNDGFKISPETVIRLLNALPELIRDVERLRRQNPL